MNTSDATWGIVQDLDPLLVRFSGDDVDTPISMKANNAYARVGDKVLLVRAGPVSGWVLSSVIQSASTSDWTYATGSDLVVMATDWTYSRFECYYTSALMWVRLLAIRANSTYNVPTSGNITNVVLADLIEPLRGNTAALQPLSVASTGRITGGYIRASDGRISLAAAGAGGTDIAIGETIELGGLFFRGNPT